MCEVVVVKFKHDNLEKRNMPRFLPTLKNFTKVETLAASSGFKKKIKPPFCTCRYKIFVRPSQIF